MIKQLKTLTINIFAGANVAIVLLMLATGYSDRISPASNPLLSNLCMTFPIFLLLNLLFIFFWLTFKWRKVWIDYKSGAGFDTICPYLLRQEADIVCLQEDVDTWRRYVFHRYQKIYPYNDTIFFVVHSDFTNGMGIHSRYPIIRRERIPYESKGNGSVAWYLQVGKDTVLVINNHLEATHLTLEERSNYEKMLKGKMHRDTLKEESKLILSKLGQSNVIRAEGAEAVHRYIEEHRQYPMIVCGDFNDNPISYSRHVISKGLMDCFAETGRGLGLSYNRKGFYFRIDHILCSDHFTPYNCQVDDKIDASDHYPIFCWLKLVHKP